jgi:hypothetical protein
MKTVQSEKTGDKIVFSPKLVLRGVSAPVLVFALPAPGLLHIFFIKSKSSRNRIQQIFWTDIQFHETVPNFTHCTDTLNFGMKCSLEGHPMRKQTQGDFANNFWVFR